MYAVGYKGNRKFKEKNPTFMMNFFWEWGGVGWGGDMSVYKTLRQNYSSPVSVKKVCMGDWML